MVAIIARICKFSFLVKTCSHMFLTIRTYKIIRYLHILSHYTPIKKQIVKADPCKDIPNTQLSVNIQTNNIQKIAFSYAEHSISNSHRSNTQHSILEERKSYLQPNHLSRINKCRVYICLGEKNV